MQAFSHLHFLRCFFFLCKAGKEQLLLLLQVLLYIMPSVVLPIELTAEIPLKAFPDKEDPGWHVLSPPDGPQQ